MNEITVNENKNEISTEVMAGIAQCMLNAMASVIETAQELVRLIDSQPLFAEQLAAQYPKIGMAIIKNFERIGRKQMIPGLMWDASPGASALRRMPYSLQEKYYDNVVPLLVNAESGWDVLRTPIGSLTKDQAAQVFNGETIRTEAQQRAWIEDRRSREAIKTVNKVEPYRIVGKELLVTAHCVFTAKDLASILSRIS